MLHKRLKLSYLLWLGLVLPLPWLQAQEAIPATGGIATGSGGSVSHSVGQVVYTTNTGTTGSVAQGVQQPYEISVITEVDEIRKSHFEISAFPNPATDHVLLIIENGNLPTLNFQLYDINGKLLQAKKISGKQTSITMGGWPPSTYFLKVMQNDEVVRTFKIIKN